jgi:cobalt-zinc-cadmium efflux system outer membrane protein
MRTIERALPAAVLAAAACATASPREDLARVASLAQVPLPARTAERPVALEPADEIREILARPLTADDAVRVALLNNRELRATLREVVAARGRATQAGTLPNPAFEFDLRAPEDDEPLQKDFLVEWELTRAIFARPRARAAEAEVHAEQHRAAAAALGLAYEVRAAFYAHQAAEQRLASTNRTLDALAAARDAARALFRAGNLRELDLASNEAAYETARADAAVVELELLDGREELQRLMGLHGKATTWRSSGPLPTVPDAPPGATDVEAKAVATSLELAELRERMQSLARRAGLVRAEGLWPDVTVDVHAEQDGTRWEIGGGAKIALPVFDRRQGDVATARAELEALEERYQGAAVDVRSAARIASQRSESTWRRARQYQGVIVPARERVLAATLLQYNAMQVGVFALLDAHRARLDAELAAVDAVRDHWIARAAEETLGAGRRAGDMRPTRAPRRVTGREAAGGH